MIDRLPAHSRYGAAVLDDPETAARLAELDDDADSEMPLAGFDEMRALMSTLIDAVNQNTAATIAAAGTDPPQIPPMPRPVTGVQKARNRLRMESRDAFAAFLTGELIQSDT